MIPPPIISRFFGISSKSKIEVEFNILLSEGKEPSLIDEDPVAIIAFLKLII